MTYNTRENIRYYDQLWPGARQILDPKQVAEWKMWAGGGWAFGDIYDETQHLKCAVDPDPNSSYHFLLHFQYSQSMKETVDSLPSRIHVPGSGTNTFQIPLYDLEPTLDLLSNHTNYDIVISNEVFGFYQNVVKEDELIKSLADITDDDKEEIAKIREVYDRSETINHDLITPFRFQMAGVAMMLHIYGVADRLIPGYVHERQPVLQLSKLTPKADDPQMSLDIIGDFLKS